MKKDKLKKAPEAGIETPSEKTARAVIRYLRISPRKVRLVVDAIRHQSVGRAFERLLVFKKKAARLTEKALKSAVANAKGIGMDENRLYISDIRADEGPRMKRFMSRSMGRADRILKRMTHLSVHLKEGSKRWSGSREDDVQKQQEMKPGKEKTALKVSSESGAKKKTAGASA